MITVTRLDRSTYAINPDLIERIVESPDTSLHMVDGSTYIVAESMAQTIELIARYRAYVLAIARDLTASAPADRTLTVVRPGDTPADRASVPGPRTPRK
jgi:flagellar protein FlbD